MLSPLEMIAANSALVTGRSGSNLLSSTPNTIPFAVSYTHLDVYKRQLMDGKTADKYGYVKNDLLKVDVVKIIDRTFKRIGKPIPTEKELYTLTNNDSLTWGIYENGVTICINQIEREATQKKAMKYAPKNISEIAAFVAAIRPSFKSMVSTFLNRETFAYGISSFDEIIQTTQLPQSFILYQEMIMSALVYAGFPVAETYTIIKAVSYTHLILSLVG